MEGSPHRATTSLSDEDLAPPYSGSLSKISNKRVWYLSAYRKEVGGIGRHNRHVIDESSCSDLLIERILRIWDALSAHVDPQTGPVKLFVQLSLGEDNNDN
jgi:hypothetical protein